MTRLLATVSIAAVAGGIVLIVAGTPLAGVLLLLAGLVLGTVLGAIASYRSVRSAVQDWRSIFSGGGPQTVRVVGLQPPQGVLFNRDAVVTVEVTGQDGTSRRVEREVGVPIPQAIAWKLAGRVPTPIGKLTEAREVDFAVYRRKPPATS